jgi:hypothetical protein
MMNRTISMHDRLAMIDSVDLKGAKAMDDRDTQEQPSEATWPGVHRAYDFVGPSYALILQRLDAANSHLQTLQAFAASIALGAPILAASVVKDIDFHSPWFYSALVTLGALIVIGAVARILGAVQLVTPQMLYDKWLNYTEWEFKKNAVYWAGRHFKDNYTLVNNKALAAFGMTVLLLAEMGLLLGWVMTQL